MCAGHPQDLAMAGAEPGAGHREQRVRGRGVPGAAAIRGQSVLVDPMGVVEADLGFDPGVRTVEVSVETVERESFPMFRQRRL